MVQFLHPRMVKFYGYRLRQLFLTERTGVQIYFVDPHSPWQRGSNENTNGLLPQYMPKGSDLSIYSQEELDAIALSFNTRPRARLNSESPLVVYTQHIALRQHPTDTVNYHSVALGS